MFSSVALGAVSAAAVSYLSLIVSKEQKTSEFRQSWIDALRAEIAEFIGRVNAIQRQLYLAVYDEEGVQSNKIVSDYLLMRSSASKICLRLNTAEQKANNVINNVNKLATEIDTVAQPFLEDEQIIAAGGKLKESRPSF